MNRLYRYILMIIWLSGTACNQDLPPERPNILFALADDISYPHMGAYGTDWIQTPAFDRVAANGILFTKAYTPNSKCSPSRASILTGRNTWQLESGANHIVHWPKKFKTYTDVLMEQGYHVGYTAKGYDPYVDGERKSICGPGYNKYTKEVPADRIFKNDYVKNFKDFLASREADEPFCFWYTSLEPHRRYTFQSGTDLAGKKPADIDHVPSFWPDNDTIRHDLLDYAFEIEYFDQQLQQMLEILEQTGELENTLVIVTSDNGMPFPRIKGQAYEYATHLPLAIMWPAGINNPGRVVEDYVSFVDFAPTFLELGNIKPGKSGMLPMAGKSLTDIFYSGQEGKVNPERDFVLVGKERHDIGRPNDWGYPIRGLVRDDFLYLYNFEPDRWPAGNPETGYLNCDGSPTKTAILEQRRNGINQSYWNWCFGKRPQEELYSLENDPENLINLADKPELKQLKQQMKQELWHRLAQEGDPRMLGKGDVFDKYPYGHDNGRHFYERYMAGDSTLNWGWVNPGDFEDESLEL
ncbi:MAG: sulfatase family protein [Candidatus Cyclobacteriaceae bacterium M3_2C_046]